MTSNHLKFCSKYGKGLVGACSYCWHIRSMIKSGYYPFIGEKIPEEELNYYKRLAE